MLCTKVHRVVQTEKYTECTADTHVNKVTEMVKCVGIKMYAEKVLHYITKN